MLCSTSFYWHAQITTSDSEMKTCLLDDGMGVSPEVCGSAREQTATVTTAALRKVRSQIAALRLHQNESCDAITHQLAAVQDRLRTTSTAVSTALRNSIQATHQAQQALQQQEATAARRLETSVALAAATVGASILPVAPARIMPSTVAHLPMASAPQMVIADSRGSAQMGTTVDWNQLCPQVPWSSAEQLLRELDLQQYVPICRIQARPLHRAWLLIESLVAFYPCRADAPRPPCEYPEYPDYPVSTLSTLTLGCERATDANAVQAVDLNVLLHSSEADLLGLGISALGHRRRITVALDPYR
jgi:DNA-binding FrmR family transcriptional regulator